MTRMLMAVVMAGALLAGDGLRAEENAISSQPIRLEHCLVSLIDDLDIPAERAGVLRRLSVQEGDDVEKDAPLAEIDREQADAQWRTAQAEADTARVKSESRLEADHAAVEHEVRLAEHRMSSEANRKEANSVSLVELERLRLAAEQARIKILLAMEQQKVRGLELKGLDAKAEQAAIDVRSRTVRAPLAGEVVEVFYRPGEWVEPGKPLLRLARLERLRVEGFVSFRKTRPHALKGAAVEARVTFAGDRIETFTGKITFVSPVVQPGGEYRIWAEVENRRVGDEWLLRPGVPAELTIVPATESKIAGAQNGD